MNNKPTKTKREFFILFTVSILFIITFIMVSMGVTSALAIFAIVGGFFIVLLLIIAIVVFVSGEVDDYHKNKTK